LKLEVKGLEQKVGVLEEEVKAQSSQDNRKNIVKKFEEEKSCISLLLNNK
jgi:hypothetical protein